ncbi:unnamed protein product [Auanema sp. JU1783]|nr:unnamed protein product [Auanema sp. JU1783]
MSSPNYYLLLFLIIHSYAADFELSTAKFALEFAAAAYSETPTDCVTKNNGTVVLRITQPCDYLKDECWGLVTLTPKHIVISFRGTRTKLQLITELVETMSEPKKKLRAGGSVQHYFYVALSSIWKPIQSVVRKLAKAYPDNDIIFTGHSLGGALASLASTVFAFRHQDLRAKIILCTFGQPRVGNYEYAEVHNALLEKSWRVVHKYDIVAHLPACAINPLSRACTSFFNHAPYHHGVEIWYPGEMNDTSLYKQCSGTPVDEDQSCSNGWYLHYGIKDHVVYYNHYVSQYGVDGCVDLPEKPN